MVNLEVGEKLATLKHSFKIIVFGEQLTMNSKSLFFKNLSN